MVSVLIHGVPDTSAMWGPFIAHLNMHADDVVTPGLPGFGSPAPSGFSCTKEAYVEWLIDTLEREASKKGPVDLIGHDWGAIFCLRAAHLRPDLIRTWAVINAAPLPGVGWHAMARIWQTPIKGELFMIFLTQNRLRKILVGAGMPDSIASVEIAKWGHRMRRAVLKLYRSAIEMGEEWGADLSGLPDRGLVLWGDQDKFVPLKFGRQFCDEWNVPLHVECGAGHWAVCERPNAFAVRLKQHWNSENLAS